MSSSPVAVIDIGSNSIKTLVAERADDGQLRAVAIHTLDVRISAGIDRANPRLTDESMQRGLAAIRELVAFIAPHKPAQTVLVATSAVRDAENGADFRSLVQSATGHAIRILTGNEEASLIGRGLTCDPALASLRDFAVFDLGGGSLECLFFHDRRVQQALSLPLGCVRLTERFISAPNDPVPPAAIAAIADHTHSVLTTSRFPLPLPPSVIAIGTGGTLTTARAILAARAGLALETSDTLVELTEFRALLAELAALSLDARQKVPGLPAARADVFPAALATLIALAELGHFATYRHSLYNLRYGLAAELLGDEAPRSR